MWGVVINPISGQGLGARNGTLLTTYLTEHKITYRIISGINAAHTSESLSTFLRFFPDCEGIFAVGGDGLTHLVLQHLARTRIPLAVIPSGTGNDFVRTLGWDLQNIYEIMDQALSTPAQYVDLGLVDNEWFGSVLSTGFDSQVNERANRMNRPKGPTKYNVAIARELASFRSRPYEITLDGVTISVDAMLIAIGNGKSYGGGMQITPKADLHDGFFHITILRKISKWEFLKFFPKVYSGAHTSHPAVDQYQCKRIQISATALAYADGERIGPLPISAETVPSALLTWFR